MSNIFSSLVTVIIPCLNEEKYITQVLANVLSQDYPKDKLEVFVVDGGSNDGTVNKVKRFCVQYPFVKLLSNPARHVSHALNLAIRESKGDVIIRLDAHSLYPSDYISRLVSGLFNSDADNTGGVWITEPGNETNEAMAIALATSHPFGIGNASYRLGASEPKFVDTVPYGCYRRSVFNRIGYFDEQLVRNQDDEFNGRLIANGGKILLIPDVKIRYFARENIAKMSLMFYQYGLFKPLVNLKLGRPATIRQLFPPGLVAGLISSLLLSLVWPVVIFFFLFIVLSYFSLVIFFSLKLDSNRGMFFKLITIFPSIHFSYGCGYLRGILKFVILRAHKRTHSSTIPLNR